MDCIFSGDQEKDEMNEEEPSPDNHSQVDRSDMFIHRLQTENVPYLRDQIGNEICGKMEPHLDMNTARREALRTRREIDSSEP